MAYYYKEPSHTFSEYLLVPGYSSSECIPANVSLKTPLVKFRKGEEPALSLNIPLGIVIVYVFPSSINLDVSTSIPNFHSFLYSLPFPFYLFGLNVSVTCHPRLGGA